MTVLIRIQKSWYWRSLTFIFRLVVIIGKNVPSHSLSVLDMKEFLMSFLVIVKKNYSEIIKGFDVTCAYVFVFYLHRREFISFCALG